MTGHILALVLTLTAPVDLSAQQVAALRAQWMVAHSHRWHPPFRVGRVFSHARFEGVGWGGPGRRQLGTCRPRRRGLRLIGDATARGARMSARVRLWR